MPESAIAVEITTHRRDVDMAWFEFDVFNILDLWPADSRLYQHEFPVAPQSFWTQVQARPC